MAQILVIEDDLQLRIMFEKFLKLDGHQVTTASDGAEGVSRFRAAPVDLVLLDMYMPNQDGVETISRFRMEFPDVPLIAMSGNDAAAAALAVAKHLGVTAILQKPFTSEQLNNAVKKALPGAL